MSTAKTVLMVGGPADGRWMVADGYDIVVAEPPATIDWLAETDSAIPAFRQVRYSVQSWTVLGLTVDIAVAEGEFRSRGDRAKAIVRALFQRDVAAAMAGR